MLASINPWWLLLAAGILEVVWALAMKASDGFTKPAMTAITLVAASASFGLLGLALKSMPVGTAYAVWTGIGAVGAAVFGVIWFGEAVTVLRVVSVLLILAGIAGLKLAH
jgi:quaternary ammonium compound-resistance protein SugE